MKHNIPHKNVRGIISNFAVVTIILQTILLVSCEKSKDINTNNIIPARFRIEVPTSISSSNTKSTSKSDTLQGDDIYKNLRNFIHVGDMSAKITEDIIHMIASHNLNKPMEFTITSNDDNRSKLISIVENVLFENENWQYQLTLQDTESQGVGLQIFWNTTPIKGVSIMNWYNINRNSPSTSINSMYRVDYSEEITTSYDRQMTVYLTNLPANTQQDTFAINSLKMHVGKKGDIIHVYGNSQHPNAQFLSNNIGFNWAFVSAASKSQNIAVAEVGLPPINFNSNDREILLNNYSIENVLRFEVLYRWPNIPTDILNTFLQNTKAPGFFGQGGFIQANTPPSGNYTELNSAIENLNPYNPKDIFELEIQFKE